VAGYDRKTWPRLILRQKFSPATSLSGAGIAQWYSTGLRAGWSEVRVLAEARNFSLHHSWVPKALFLGVRRLRREADHSPPLPRSRIRGAIPPLPQYVFMAWCLVKHIDNFIFYHRCVQTGSGAHPFSYPGVLSLGVKWPVPEADHSPPSSAKVKNSWSYTPTSPIRLNGVLLRLKKSTGAILPFLLLCHLSNNPLSYFMDIILKTRCTEVVKNISLQHFSMC
jgi:hypothetical protein